MNKEVNSAETKPTYMRVSRATRQTAFADGAHLSLLVRVSSDLRRACVSRWLNGGVPATQTAEWADHSVEVLKVSAKCLDGHDEVARRRVQGGPGIRPNLSHELGRVLGVDTR